MEYDKRICDLVPGDEVEGFYLIRNASLRVSSSGKPYLSATFSDISGSIEAKMWDYSGPVSSNDDGSVIKIRGEVGEYKGTPQLTLKKIRTVAEGDRYDVSRIIPTAPVDPEKELEYVQNLVASIEDEDYRRVCEIMLDRHVVSFCRIPAAKSIHHSFVSGLLMHTANMLRIADFLSTKIYPDAVDRSLLLAGTLLHDFAKEKEFEVSPLGSVKGMTTEGVLVGHLVMGAEEVGRIGEIYGIPQEKTLLLRHMILSHHGQPEFGAAVIPCIAEAELLSYIDLMDSRMEIYAETFESLPTGTFSDRIYALEKRIYNHE